MQTVIDLSVRLQKNHQYSFIALIVAALIVLSPLIWWIVKKLLGIKPKEKKASSKVQTTKKIVNRRPLNVIKDDFIKRIDAIEKKYNDKAIDSREMHQKLSVTVRQFVSEVKGIPADALVLSDFERMQMPEMEKLLEAFYAPEFAPEEVIKLQSADNARKVVREWN
ncbi:MAG: hypothetical protein MJ153_01725 [Clostridia bacterium]|nr:hypothetical protein [Clostridia bacterium]